MNKSYSIGEGVDLTYTHHAHIAMDWHRKGHDVTVWTIDGTKEPITVHGATQPEQPDKNRRHCKHIAHELEAYVDGNVYRCPECNEVIRIPANVGDKFRCPHCHNVTDIDDYEQSSVWDYMQDILDVEYRCGSDKEYRSCKIMVACGGPNIYIDTAAAMVKLYWWTEYAEYPISYEARDAVDEWAEEYWNI